MTVVIDLCTKDLKELLELITREMKYNEVRDEITSFCGKEKDFFGTQLKAMEVDNYEEMGEQVWWGGSEPWYRDGWEVSSGGEVCQMNASWGKGLWQEKVSKGKGREKREKGWGKKGGSEGNGKDDKEKGKGKGGRFQGNCQWCGEWGHSQSRCRHKDEHMNGKEWAPGEQHGGRQAAGPTRPGDTGEL